jgi:hypothetical protein
MLMGVHRKKKPWLGYLLHSYAIEQDDQVNTKTYKINLLHISKTKHSIFWNIDSIKTMRTKFKIKIDIYYSTFCKDKFESYKSEL